MKRPSIHSSTTSAKKRKAVRFASTENLTKVVTFDQHASSQQEKSNIWYQPSDYQQIRKDIDDTILELQQIEQDLRYWDTKTYTLRGIEARFSSRYRLQRRQVQRATTRMVLKAQSEFGYKGDEATHKIQRVSKMCSKAARLRAEEVGALDQYAAGFGKPFIKLHHQESSMTDFIDIDAPSITETAKQRPSLIIAQPA